VKAIGFYSHNDGSNVVRQGYSSEYEQVLECIRNVDAGPLQSKVSKEKTMPGDLLYSPRALNKRFKEEFAKRGWQTVRINVSTKVELDENADEASRRKYSDGYVHTGFREIDFVKNKLGVEVQFGKYAFMVYNVAAKMTIFHKQGIIDAGIEIVPMKSFSDKMSTGVSFFEQFKTDLEMRGVADIDIPVLIVGVDVD
jgi:hypothetical protein